MTPPKPLPTDIRSGPGRPTGTVHTYPCGHSQTYYRMKPAETCSTCTSEKNMAMGRAHSALVREEKRQRDKRYRAEDAHSYGRPHDEAICPLCAASRAADALMFCEAMAGIFSQVPVPRGFK